jgi:hypothetical protein
MAFPVGTTRAFQYGLGIFALTALIGLFNATKIIGTIDQNTLLTHLHSGTLGWITMGVIGVAVWMFGGSSPTVARNIGLSALATAAYVLAFWSGNFIARAVFGSIELLVIVGWWWWVLSRSLAQGFGVISVPKLSVLLALTTLVIGSTVGVILQILFATNNVNEQNGVLIGVHASAQVGGYLVLVAAGIAEWQLSGEGRTTAGLVQAVLLFFAGLLLALGILLNVTPALLLSNLFQTVAIVMIAFRVGRRAFGISWNAPTGLRHEAIAVAWLVVALILFVVLTQQLIAAQGDNSKVPPGLFIALDHTMFIGVMTNALFGAILALGAPRTWPWADHVIFWGLNIGAASFVAVLLTAGSSAGAGPFSHPVAFTAPIMGLSVLLGIVTYSLRLTSVVPAAVRTPAPA